MRAVTVTVVVPVPDPGVSCSRPVAASMVAAATPGVEFVTEKVGAAVSGTARRVSMETVPPSRTMDRSISVRSGDERFIASALTPSSHGRVPGVP